MPWWPLSWVTAGARRQHAAYRSRLAQSGPPGFSAALMGRQRVVMANSGTDMGCVAMVEPLGLCGSRRARALNAARAPRVGTSMQRRR